MKSFSGRSNNQPVWSYRRAGSIVCLTLCVATTRYAQALTLGVSRRFTLNDSASRFFRHSTLSGTEKRHWSAELVCFGSGIARGHNIVFTCWINLFNGSGVTCSSPSYSCDEEMGDKAARSHRHLAMRGVSWLFVTICGTLNSSSSG
jgi:hypothetical protein